MNFILETGSTDVSSLQLVGRSIGRKTTADAEALYAGPDQTVSQSAVRQEAI